MSLGRSLQDPNRLFIGMQSGIKTIYRVGDKWKDEGRIAGIEQEIDLIFENPEGKVWLATREDEILLLDLSTSGLSAPVITSFDTTSGLPPGERNIPFSTIKGLRFGTNKGVYRLNEDQKS